MALVLLASVAVSAVLWWNAQFSDIRLQTTGRVAEGHVIASHYNAQLTKQRVVLVYTYSVGGVMYKARWTGYWPTENSPNALPADQYPKLFTQGHSLKVFYEPGNPANSELHRCAPESHLLLAGTTVGLGILASVYLVRIYPAWRSHIGL
jgi:hypothetical protein